MGVAESSTAAVFTARRGDRWARTWTRAEGDREFVPDSLVVQIRAGTSEDGRLVASTPNGAGYHAETHALISTEGTALDGDPATITLEISAAHTLRMAESVNYQVEMEALVLVGEEEVPVTIMPARPFVVAAQVAVREVTGG